MKKLKIIIDGKHYSRSIPEELPEITLGQYLEFISRIDTEKPDLTTLSVLFDIPEAELLKVPALQYQDLVTYIAWLNKVDFFKGITNARLKNKVHVAGIPYSYPTSIDKIQIGQKLYLDSVINRAVKEDKAEYQIYAEILAVFLMPCVYVDYKEERLPEFKELLLRESAMELVPLVNFFLNKYTTLTYAGAISSLVKGLRESWGLALKSWISLVSSRCYTIWQKVTLQKWRK